MKSEPKRKISKKNLAIRKKTKTLEAPPFLDIEFNSDKTKDLILKEALRIISEHGLQALNMREVARNLNISHGTPYRHFKTKDDVVIALGVIGFQLFAKTLEKDLPIPITKELLLERLKKLKENYILFATKNPELYNIIFNTRLPQKGENSELQEVAHQAFSVLLNQMASMKTAGILKIDDVFSASMLIFTQLHGHILLQNIGVMDGLIYGFQYKKNISDEIDTHFDKLLSNTED
jgi:AcrR family transcriptional regulator